MNNIPDFLAHLPIWNDKPMDGVRGVPVRYGKQKRKKSTRVREHQYDAYDHKTSNMVTKVCPVCGKTYQVAYRLRDISKTCSRACGSTLKYKDSIGWRERPGNCALKVARMRLYLQQLVRLLVLCGNYLNVEV